MDNVIADKYQARQAINCSFCVVIFQLATKTDLLRAATASGGDLIEYYIDDEEDEVGRLN